MFIAICVNNPGSEWSTTSTVGRMWPTAELVREHFEEAWAAANSSYLGSYNKTPKAYGIAQVVEGIDVDQRMTFKPAPVDAFKAQADKPAKPDAGARRSINCATTTPICSSWTSHSSPRLTKKAFAAILAASRSARLRV